jgi:hypothetical protein
VQGLKRRDVDLRCVSVATAGGGGDHRARRHALSKEAGTSPKRGACESAIGLRRVPRNQARSRAMPSSVYR